MVGLIRVTETVAQARQLDVILGQVFEAQNWGAYTSVDIARNVGLVVIVVNIVCLVLAITFSVPRIRQGRPSFWIPLVCAAIWLVLTLVLVFAAVAADPAFMARIARAS